MEGAFSVVKKKKELLGILTVAACAGLMFLAQPGTALYAQKSSSDSLPSRVSPKAQKLLDRAIQALGGQAFLHFKNLSTSGQVYRFYLGQMTMIEPFKNLYVPPDTRRFSYGKGNAIIMVNVGDKNWEYAHQGLDSQSYKELQRWKIANRFGIDNLFRRLIKEKGVLILDNGVDFVSNRTADVIEIFDAQNDRIKLYLHRSDFLPLRVAYRVENPATHEREDYVDKYSNYQRVDGIMTPMSIQRTRNGYRYGAIFRTTAKYNVPVKPNYFKPPR